MFVADVDDRHAAGDEAAGVRGERHALKRNRLLELRLHRLLEALHVRVVPVAHARRRVAHDLDLALRDFLDELDALVLRLGPDRAQVEVDPDLGRNAVEGGALRLDDRGRQDVRPVVDAVRQRMAAVPLLLDLHDGRGEARDEVLAFPRGGRMPALALQRGLHHELALRRVADLGVGAVHDDDHAARTVSLLLDHPRRREAAQLLVGAEDAAHGDVLPGQRDERLRDGERTALVVAHAAAGEPSVVVLEGVLSLVRGRHDVQVRGDDVVLDLAGLGRREEQLAPRTVGLDRAEQAAGLQVSLHRPRGAVDLRVVNGRARDLHQFLEELEISSLHRARRERASGQACEQLRHE